MAKKRTFVKCGKNARCFADPFSKFDIAKGEVKELKSFKQKRSVKMKNALRGGHLELATEEEFLKFQQNLSEGTLNKKEDVNPDGKEPTFQEILEDKTKAELVLYYEEKYEVGPEDIEAFKKLKHDAMVAELLDLENEEE